MEKQNASSEARASGISNVPARRLNQSNNKQQSTLNKSNNSNRKSELNQSVGKSSKLQSSAGLKFKRPS